jgi:hypothetical protein
MEKAAAEFGAISEAVVFLDYFKELPDPRQCGKVSMAITSAGAPVSAATHLPAHNRDGASAH